MTKFEFVATGLLIAVAPDPRSDCTAGPERLKRTQSGLMNVAIGCGSSLEVSTLGIRKWLFHREAVTDLPLNERSVELTADARLATPGADIGSERTLRRTRLGTVFTLPLRRGTTAALLFGV